MYTMCTCDVMWRRDRLLQKRKNTCPGTCSAHVWVQCFAGVFCLPVVDPVFALVLQSSKISQFKDGPMFAYNFSTSIDVKC